MPAFVIPFAIFFACCVAQFFLIYRVKRALAARHPDILRRLRGKSFFAFSDNAIIKFAWKRRDIGLNDPDLTNVVRQLRLLIVVAYAAWGLYALAIITGAGSQPISIDWPLTGGALSSISKSENIGMAPYLSAKGVSRAFGPVFCAALLGNVIYLALAWGLSLKWNSLGLDPTVTIGEPIAVLGVIWWFKPASRDGSFLRMRLATRVAFLVALAGTFSVFALAFLMGS